MARRESTLYALLAACSITAWACNSTADPSSRVSRALDQERIQGVDLNWEADTHALVMRGEVESLDQRAQAGRLADQAAGRGVMVVNELDVAGTMARVNDLDGSLERRLKLLVAADPELKDRPIAIDVEDGVVTIKGDVHSERERARAEQLAWQLAGVRDVANALEVTS